MTLWKLVGKGYVARKTTTKDRKSICIYLHRVLTDAPPAVQVDHWNRNKLDNQRFNLRLATQSHNQVNRPKIRGYSGKQLTSVFKGVCFCPHRKERQWRASIGLNGGKLHLGYFETEFDAAMAYNAKATEMHGYFAMLNGV